MSVGARANLPYLLLPGVYVGCSYQDYTDVVLAATSKLAPQAIVGSGASFMVGRLSYAFGLTGGYISNPQHSAVSFLSPVLTAKVATMFKFELISVINDKCVLRCRPMRFH